MKTPTTKNSTKQPDPDITLAHDKLVFWTHDGKAHMLHIQNDMDAQNPRAESDHFTTMACFHPRHTGLGDPKSVTGKTPGEFWADLVMNIIPEDAALRVMKSGKIIVPTEPDDEFANDYDRLEALREWIEDGDPDALEAAMKITQDYMACLPIWLYEHSGLTISCGARTYPYNDQFDSSALGWIVALKTDVIRELQADEKNWREKAEACMKSEIDTYDRWLRGDVWGAGLYTAKKPDTESETGASDWDDGDWTFGFYGDGVIESGIAENFQCGLAEAIKTGQYQTGEAQAHAITVWSYTKDE